MIVPDKKAKLPKGFAYPLKTSVFNQLIEESAIKMNIQLNFVFWQSEGSILKAEYWMPNKNIHYRRLYVRAGAVSAEQRIFARQALETVGLPKFVEWVSSLNRLPDNSPTLWHHPFFDAVWSDNRLEIFSK